MKAGGEAELVEEIAARERDLIRAEERGNGAALLHLVAADFHGEDAHGDAVDREAFVREFLSPTVRHESARLDQLSIRIFKHVALASGVVHLRGRTEGTPFRADYHVTDVWVRRAMHWELTASYRSPLA